MHIIKFYHQTVVVGIIEKTSMPKPVNDFITSFYFTIVLPEFLRHINIVMSVKFTYKSQRKFPISLKYKREIKPRTSTTPLYIYAIFHSITTTTTFKGPPFVSFPQNCIFTFNRIDLNVMKIDEKNFYTILLCMKTPRIVNLIYDSIFIYIHTHLNQP